MSLKLVKFLSVALIIGIGLMTYSFFRTEKSTDTLSASPQPATVSASLVPMILPPTLNSNAGKIASVSAQSYLVFDVASESYITSQNPNMRLMPASTTKIMTALIALSEYDSEEIITITRASAAIGHTVDFTPGQQFRAGDMIKAMMVNSGNDAAVSLADHHPFGYQTFVDLMNQKAISLGLKDTHFSNVSGVEANDHYSTAHDLAVLALEAMKNPIFREMVNTKTGTIATIDNKQTLQLENLNQLLWDVPGVIGIKTGWTENAGDCLVTYISRDGHDVVVVVLNSKDRFADSTALINWTYKNTRWE